MINETPASLGPKVAIDIETDEHDHFVGGCIYDGGDRVFYITDSAQFQSLVANKKIIGYNVKADLHWLKQMGLSVTPDDIYSDPMIKSYVISSNREDQGLKAVAREELGWKWPSYRDMVGSGRKKVTLDKQEIEKVAEYCGMDTLAAWKLDEHLEAKLSPAQKKLYYGIELPTYRLLWEMESTGVEISLTRLNELDKEFDDQLRVLFANLQGFKAFWNPNSPPQNKEVLKQYGIHVVKTDKAALEPYKSQPIVSTLLAYKRLKKLHSTYVCAFRQFPTLPVIHTTFNQVALQTDGGLHGIRTGRLSSNNPNLQNIPSHGEGLKLREMFVPRQGKVFIDADYSQIEYRLLAHYSQEAHLVKAFLNGFDVHEATAKLILGKTSVTKEERGIGKLLNFASVYGSQAERISIAAKITRAEAQTFLDNYWQSLPKVAQWVTQTKILARARGGVTTMSGRWIPLPDLSSKSKWDRMHAERAAVNYVIQGSAADILKVAMLELKKQGFTAVLQVHDELLFEAEPDKAEATLAKVKQIMENVVQLSVPLVADVHVGKTWREAKNE